jgi:alcohol dehydrogenase
MKAAVLHAFGEELRLENLPDPVPGTGDVVVEIAAALVLPYTSEVLSGERGYLLKLPVIPGCGAVGRVRSVGPDATHLSIGDWVFCDPTVRSRDDALAPDITLQGWSARGQGGMRLQEYFHDGPFAEQIRVPTENAIRLGSIEANDAGHWCALLTTLVPYGGLLAADLKAGETLLVSGATGNFGSSAVCVALAMGVGCVIAPGRNESVLAELVRRFGARVRPVVLTGEEAADREKMLRAAPGPIDCVLDLLPPSASTTAVRAAMMTVRPYGRIILMGGVGMLGGPDLEIPYPWLMRNLITVRGQWMYSPDAVSRLASLVHAGLLDLTQYAVSEFDLSDANEAVAHAHTTRSAFNMTIIRP